MLHRKSRRATIYRQHPNALSVLAIQTMMLYQCFQALCGISLVTTNKRLFYMRAAQKHQLLTTSHDLVSRGD
jgi:hypothetical protein